MTFARYEIDKLTLVVAALLVQHLLTVSPVLGAELPLPMPVKAPVLVKAPVPQLYDWTGFYLGPHLGYAWGRSNWTEQPDGLSGSLNMFQRYDAFTNTGSWFGGFQAGYDYMLPNRVVIGVVADLSAPSFQSLNGISIGGTSTFVLPMLGQESLSETVLDMGTFRGRIGYAPGNWLFYATGGFAWAYDQFTLNQLANASTTDMPFLWRFGWAAGAGVELPLVSNWTAGLEYLYTRYGTSTVGYANAAQTSQSDLSLQELRLTLNYRPGANQTPASDVASWLALSDDRFNVHGQSTFVWQAYPAMRSPYQGANSLPGAGQGRETWDVTLYIGMRLWQGAEVWIDPEIDQGHGLADTHGVAGFTSAESYKLGFSYPYARVQRAFLRQTIDLGGDSGKVDADINQFAQTQTSDRLVLTLGKFSVVDMFDTNKYANSPRIDFLNWSSVNVGSFDYAGDAWAYTYGAAAEWYQGNWTLRGGLFDMSQTPAGGGGDSAEGFGLDPTFNNFEMVGEIEERHQLWGQPGKLKITGFLIRGRMGTFADAIALSQATGLDVSDVLAAVRTYQSRPGLSLNLEQQITPSVGLFARAGWADGNVEPWDNTDIDRSAEAGVSVNGTLWNRPNDTVGIAGVLNSISSAHEAYFNAGGLGIVIGDGQLPKPGLEEILETYYSYALTQATKISLDYQFINNPAYNTQRGPANAFAVRLHTQF
jgi:high affinity Mn2+ porin